MHIVKKWVWLFHHSNWCYRVLMLKHPLISKYERDKIYWNTKRYQNLLKKHHKEMKTL